MLFYYCRLQTLSTTRKSATSSTWSQLLHTSSWIKRRQSSADLRIPSMLGRAQKWPKMMNLKVFRIWLATKHKNGILSGYLNWPQRPSQTKWQSQQEKSSIQWMESQLSSKIWCPSFSLQSMNEPLLLWYTQWKNDTSVQSPVTHWQTQTELLTWRRGRLNTLYSRL